MPSPEPDPIAAFLYELLADHVPLGSLKDAVDLARTSKRVDPDPELVAIAERLAEELVEGEGGPLVVTRVVAPPTSPFTDPIQTPPPTWGGVNSIPELPPGQKRTAKEAIVLAFEANPERRLMKAAHIATSVGEDRSKHALRFAIQELVADGILTGQGATASRAYFLTTSEPDHDDAGEPLTGQDLAGDTGADDHDDAPSDGREHRGSVDGGRESGSAAVGTYNPPGTTRTIETSQGSSDHAGSAENLPPRSPSSVGDKSPSGGESTAAASPPDLEDEEPFVPYRPEPKAAPAAAPRNSVEAVVAEISPWVLGQQTFRKRQLVETFPGFDPDEIRLALTRLAPKLRMEQVGGEPMYHVIGNEDQGGAGQPGASSGTAEGKVMAFVESKGSTGANVGSVATAAGVSNDEASMILSKLWRERDVRVTTSDGDSVYVAA